MYRGAKKEPVAEFIVYPSEDLYVLRRDPIYFATSDEGAKDESS